MIRNANSLNITNKKLRYGIDFLFDENYFNEDLNKKERFLKKLKSANGYKRYNASPLRYGGGKSLAVGYIIENLPENIKRVVSPFVGGASVEIAIAKELGIEVVAFDIFDLLVNYWNIQINKPEELYHKLKHFKSNKEEYEQIKTFLKKIWNKNNGLLPNDLTDVELAAYYYYSHNLSYGPGFLGWFSSIYNDEKKYLAMLEKVRNFEVSNFYVHNQSFEISIPNHADDFLYLDPPYYLGGDSKMFKGIYPMRNFPIHHNNFDHQLLFELLKEHKSGFILSYNDCSWVRKTYKDYQITEITWQYTMGQGETRIGKNRLERNYDNTNIKSSHELLIIG